MVLGGSLIEKLHMQQYVESFTLTAGSVDIEAPDLTKRDRLTYAKEQMSATFKSISRYLDRCRYRRSHPQLDSRRMGLGGTRQQQSVRRDSGCRPIGVPMYADIFGSIPIAEALLYKGAQLGTVLSFRWRSPRFRCRR